MKNFYEMTNKDFYDMSPSDLIETAQKYKVTDYAYKDVLFDPEFDSPDDCIDSDILKHSMINHIETFNNIVKYIKNEFSEELVSINLGYGDIDFIIHTELSDFKFHINKDNLCDDLLIGVSFKKERPDENRDDRDRSKKISGVCTQIAKDETYGNDDKALEYDVDYDEIYDFIAEVIDNPGKFM